MTARPILFSAPMVRALLSGAKTQTRRTVKPTPPPGAASFGTYYHPDPRPHFWAFDGDALMDFAVPCPYGQPGDRLWVREAFYREFDRAPQSDEERLEWVESGYLAYRASDEQPYGSGGMLPWRPSIHMPRWASRITLEITGVRVERLKDISESDALAEGVRQYSTLERIQAGQDRWARHAFRELWTSINGTGSWDANPWVWVVEFRRVEA